MMDESHFKRWSHLILSRSYVVYKNTLIVCKKGLRNAQALLFIDSEFLLFWSSCSLFFSFVCFFCFHTSPISPKKRPTSVSERLFVSLSFPFFPPHTHPQLFPSFFIFLVSTAPHCVCVSLHSLPPSHPHHRVFCDNFTLFCVCFFFEPQTVIKQGRSLLSLVLSQLMDPTLVCPFYSKHSK